jgi:hypothetical protein
MTDTKKEAKAKAEAKAIKLLNDGYEVTPFIFGEKAITFKFKISDKTGYDMCGFPFATEFKAGYREVWHDDTKPEHPDIIWFDARGKTKTGHGVDYWLRTRLVPDESENLARLEKFISGNSSALCDGVDCRLCKHGSFEMNREDCAESFNRDLFKRICEGEENE